MGRFLATLATLLILVLCAAFVLPAITDWNDYRSEIEEGASAILGRKINIAGDISVELLPEPHLHAVKIAADDGHSDGAAMTAEAIDLFLSLKALLSGRLETSKLKLVRPVLALDFSKPIRSLESPPEAGLFAVAPTIDNVEIEDGRVSVFAKDESVAEALALSKISGKVSALSQGNYRFVGHLLQKGRETDVKIQASSASAAGVKLSGSALDLASKSVFQADGMLNAAENPVFNGSLAIMAPRPTAGGGLPFDVQLKSSARIDFTGIVLTDLVLTLDPQNRAQVFAGSADIVFAKQFANISLQTRALDADALFASMEERGERPAPPNGGGGSSLPASADHYLWLYPSFAVRMSFSSDQFRLKGETVQGIKIVGTRTSQRWTFEEALATLPGETAFKAGGTLTRKNGTSTISGTVALTGKNLGRFGRWIAPSAHEPARLAAKAFNLQGSLTLSDTITAFEAVTGSIDGTPFTASLHVDKAPVRKLQLSLSSESFDLTGVEDGQPGATASSAESVNAAWQSTLSQITAVFGEDPRQFASADIALSARSIKTSFAEIKNLDMRAKYDEDLLTVSKLTAETAAGLSLRGEGAVPFRGSGSGRFDGRIEARSPQAILQLAAVAGNGDDVLLGRRAEDLAPAVLTINYSSDPQTGSSTAQLGGNLGPARMEGRAELKGTLTDWRSGILSGQISVSAADGNKLLAQLFPRTVLSPGASLSPGTMTLRVNGSSQRLEMSGAVKAGPVQVQLDGDAEIKAQGFGFNGKVSASSQTPEQFVPPAVLALLGGEPKVNLRIDTTLAYTPGRFGLTDLKAESPTNLVTGRLAIDTTGSLTRVDADLKADRLSLPSLLSYFLVPLPADQTPLILPASIAAPSPIWSDRPFALGALQETSAKVVLGAKTLKASDTLVLSDAQVAAKLEKGRLDIQRLDGKALGGDLTASLTLETKGSLAAGAARLSLSNADLSALPSTGTPAIVTGKASVSLSATGQGLSPQGLLSVLEGRGMIAVSDGQLPKFSPLAVQRSAEDLIAQQQPLMEAAITKKVLEASQSSDLKFGRLKIPVTIHDGVLEIRRASFRSREGTVRMEGYLDLSKMQADTSWQTGVSSDRRAKWPPVKIQISGPLRELGARPRTLAADDFVRAVLLRKMEGDMTKLEGLNKPQGALQSWTTTQVPAPEPTRRRKKRDSETPKTPPPPPDAASAATPNFDLRMRDALQSGGAASPNPR